MLKTLVALLALLGVIPTMAGAESWVLWTQSYLVFRNPRYGSRWLAAKPVQVFETRAACEAAMPSRDPVEMTHFTATTKASCWPVGVDPRIR